MRPIRFSRDIRPLSEFRANAAAFIQQVRRTRRPLVLTQHGKSAAVLLDAEEYEQLLERAELIEDIAAAEEELARGEGLEHEAAKAHLLDRLRRRESSGLPGPSGGWARSRTGSPSHWSAPS